jgi:hypothetical protein
MSFPNAASTSHANDFATAPIHAPGQQPSATPAEPFVERRRGSGARGNGERRQFGSSHEGLSEAGRELALAIDQYKMQHHRRYITCDEMLLVLSNLGYAKSPEALSENMPTGSVSDRRRP